MESKLRLCVLPDGRFPERKTEGAEGFDVYLRAIVSSREMDSQGPNLRKTLFDFKNIPTDPDISSRVLEIRGELVYRVAPGESVLGGIGFVTEMPFPMFYWVVERSGLASKWGITILNAGIPVDSDYRGEAGVLLCNRGNSPFDLRHNMRIAQVVFQYATVPNVIQVNSLGDLEITKRGAGGFGSTGLGG